MQSHDANLETIGVHNPKIVRDVGDKWGRTPHFITANGSARGILYVPGDVREGAWSWIPRACENTDDAIAFLDRKFGEPAD